MANEIVVFEDDIEESPQRRSKRVLLANLSSRPPTTLLSKKQPTSKMAVAPALMTDECIVQEDYEERECHQPGFSASPWLSKCKAIRVLLHRAQLPASTLITRAPINTVEEQTHILQAENEKLFSKFVEHCSAFTQDCPEVLTFLKTKYTKASPDYLSSVEFRNTLEQCLTCVQTNHSKTFAFINELCIVLRNRAAKKRQILTRVESGSSTSSSLQSAFVMVKNKDKTKVEEDKEVEKAGKLAAEDKLPSTAGLQEDREDNKEEQQEAEKNAKRPGKQIVYLENLLKVYYEEICRLQQAELSLDDMESEDSLYIQEHKLKCKIMKIYEKLCKMKGCNTLTGRVIEQRILYTSTRYPEINRRIEHFINSPEVHRNPPDYQDIRQQVLEANKHHNLRLSRKQLNQMACDAFRETGNSMQERRHLDLVYNFGSYLTDSYKPASDPALLDPLLKRKLQLNREVAISQLEDVITKYAIKQDDIEEQERRHQLKKKGNKSKRGKEIKDVNGVDEDEEETEEEDYSSDPDIEEEIQASTQQNGPDDDDENEEANSNGVEQAGDDANKEDQRGDFSGSTRNTEENTVISGHGNPIKTGEPVDSFSHVLEEPANFSPVAANSLYLPPPSAVTIEQSDTNTTNSISPPPCTRETRSQAWKRKEVTKNSPNSKRLINNRNGSSQSEPTQHSHVSVTVAANGMSSAPLTAVGFKPSDMHTTNGTSPTLSPREIRSQRRKRKREEATSADSPNSKHIIIGRGRPTRPEPMHTDDQNSLSSARLTEPVVSTNQVSPVAANRTSLTQPSAATLEQSDTMTRSQKRMREETTSDNWQNSDYADCTTVHCLICHKPQSNISAHLSRVCMKRSTAEERAVECQKAKASSSMWVCANRTWYYDKICELLPHRPSRFAVIKYLIRQGFFIMDLPDDLVINTGEASDMTTTSTAPTASTTISTASVDISTASTTISTASVDISMAPSATSTSETVTGTSDSLEASGTYGSPEVPVGPEALAEVLAKALASPSKYRTSRNCSLQRDSPTMRIKMRESGLYKKFPDHTNIINDFKTYLIEILHMPSYQLEVNNVSRYLRYLQPKGDILSLDFITKPAKTTNYLHKLRYMGLSTKSLVIHTRSIIRFYEFLRTHPDLKEKDSQLRTMLTTSEMMMKTLRHPNTKSYLHQGSKSSDTWKVTEENVAACKRRVSRNFEAVKKTQRCGQFSQEMISVRDCQEVLRLGKRDFTNIFDKLSSNMVVSEKEKTMYRYYLEAILLLCYFHRPTTVKNLTVQEWVNRTSAHGRVMIGTGHQKMATTLIVAVTITQEEEAWFQAYYKYIRPWHIGSRNCKKFFVTSCGTAILSASSDLTRLHNMYNLDDTRSRQFLRVVEAQAAEVLAETQKEVVAGYLAQSSAVANKHYSVLTPQKPMSKGMALEKLMNSSTEQSPREEDLTSPSGPLQQAAGEFAAFIEKFPVSKDGRPPSPKQLAKVGLTRVFYDKWRFIQMKLREAYLLSHFIQCKPSILNVAQLIKKEGWKTNHPKPKDIVQKWKPLGKSTINKNALVNSIKNQSWKGLAIKTFGDKKRLGVVATCRFTKGSIVCDYHGKIISAAEGRSLMEQKQVEANNLLFFKDLCVNSQTFPCECHPNVDSFSRRINRSTDKPNLKPIHCVLKANEQNVEQDVVLLEAITDIEVDDELTF